MKKFRKLTVVFVTALSVCLFTSCVRTDYGLNLPACFGKNSVYICNSINEEAINEMGYTKEEYLKELTEASENQGYSTWKSESVDLKFSNGDHYVGTKFTSKVSGRSTEKVLNELLIDFADVTYTERISFATHTVTLTLTPKGGAWSDVQYSTYTGKEADPDNFSYYFSINVPTEITDTNGTLTNDNKTSEWNIAPLVYNECDYINMTLTYRNYSLPVTIGIVIFLVLTAIIVLLIYHKKKTIEAGYRITRSSESISSLLAGGDDENTKRCPLCGYKLRIDEAFCVNCGEVFENTESKTVSEETKEASEEASHS